MKILLVDDEQLVLDAMSAILNRFGHDVITCSTVSEGIKEVRRSDFDVAVLDYHVGPDKGTEVSDTIRKLKPGIPFVFLSGFQTEEVRDAKVLAKPIRASELINELTIMVAGGC